MDITVIDSKSNRHLKVACPPVELFEKWDSEGNVILDLSKTLKWALDLNEKNPLFDLTAIFCGIVLMYYLKSNYKRIVIYFNNKTIEVTRSVNFVKDIHNIMDQMETLVTEWKAN